MPNPNPNPGLDKSSAAYHKRREQVRRAQRTHRERKESYVKALEDKVVQLRAREESVRSANKILRSEVERLRGVVAAPALSLGNGAGTGLGMGTWKEWGAEAWVDGIGTGTGTGSGYSQSQGGADLDMVVWNGSSGVSEMVEGDVGGWASPPRLGDGSSYPMDTQCGINNKVKQTDLAMVFVLDLEKPCIQRAQSAVFEPINPVPSGQFGQSFSAGSGMYHHFLEDSVLDATSPGEMEGSLDKLLLLSKDFDLGSKVTPVQAWQMLCRHPDFSVLDIRTVRRLVRGMMEYVVCYGFGAVIETSAFDKVCRAMFTNEGH